MCGTNYNLTAPHQERHGGLQQFGQIINEGGFIDNHHALFAAQATRGRGKGKQFKTAGKADAESLDRLVAIIITLVEQHLFGLGGRQIESACPHGAGVDEFAGHLAGIRDVHHIHAARRFRASGPENGIGGQPPGQADPA